MKEKTPLIEVLHPLRGSDHYPSQEVKEQVVDLYFPTSVCDLAINLSNITSHFYALQLQLIGEEYGVDQISGQSEKLFYKLGKLKAEQALAKDPQMPRDCRSLVLVAISAIYTSSPEFKFHVETYTSTYAVMQLKGADRYHRAAKQVKIDQYLSFPTLIPFLKGVKAYLQLGDIEVEVMQSSYNENSEVTATYVFKQNQA